MVSTVAVGQLGREFFQSVPAGVGGRSLGCSVVDVVGHGFHLTDESLGQLGIFVVLDGPVLAQKRAHGPVALAHGVDMLEGNGERHSVVYHVGYIEREVGLRYDQQLVSLVVVVAILHCDVVGHVNRQYQVVKTTVADECDRAGDMERKIVHIMLMHHRETGLKVGVVHVGTLHIYKELLIEMICKFLRALGHRLERDAEY